MAGEPVSTTVVESQSTEAARGSPAADPILEPAPAGILGAPTDESADDDAAVSEAEASPALKAGPDRIGEEAEAAEVFDSAPNGSEPEPILAADGQGADDQSGDIPGADGGNHGNVGADGEPPRHTGVLLT